MDEPMFITRIYKTDKGWSFENILTDVLPKDVNTFCTDWPKCLAWKEMMYYLNHSSKVIQRIKDRTSSKAIDTQVQ